MVRFWQLEPMVDPSVDPISNADITVLPPQPGTPTNLASQASNTSATSLASRHYQHHH